MTTTETDRSTAESRAAERVLVAQACRITGLSRRNIQDMAARGDIPGAAKLGGRWTFDAATLRQWIKSREVGRWEETSTSGGRSGGVGLGLPGSSIDEAYERALRLRP